MRACLFAVWICVASVWAMAADRPNFLWLVSEDNSIHYSNLYSPQGAESPALAKLAQHGLVFNHAFSTAPVCSVARTTLITSCYAPRIGTQYHRCSVAVPMPEGLKMFPAYLRDAGYYTTNNSKKDYNAIETKGTWDESSPKATWRGRQPNQAFFHMQSFATTHESSLHFAAAAIQTQKTLHDPALVLLPPYHPDTPTFRYTHARYLDNVQKVDSEFARVVQSLASEGLLEDTFIFCFGDHGGVLPRGKGYAYESGLHVPLVVRVPEKWKHLVPWELGARVNGFVSFVDFGPTLLRLANLSIPENVDGRPFLGTGVSAAEVEQRDEAWGYADRFDEKYDLVRTLRKGKFEYVRSFQPFNFDGLYNTYRYKMVAYREWRDLYAAGQLNETQSAFFRPRPTEMLFDIESDPFEVKDLAQDPNYANVLLELRQRMRKQLKAWPDLSFYPESFLMGQAFTDPTAFGKRHWNPIGKLIDIADLSLHEFSDVKERILEALNSPDPWERYWGFIVCSCFGNQAKEMAPLAMQEIEKKSLPLLKTRAAEFLGLIGWADPAETLQDCLEQAKSPMEAALILNSAVLLRDGNPGYSIPVSASNLSPKFLKEDAVARRLEYLDPQFAADRKAVNEKKEAAGSVTVSWQRLKRRIKKPRG